MQPSTNNLPALQNDVVEISAGNRLKEASDTEKKSGMSAGAKWALGIAGTAAAIYGTVVGRRMLSKPSLEKVTQNLSEIFNKNFSKEEAEKLLNNYKQIIKNDNTDEYLNSLFKQAKSDLGYKDLDINLVIEKLKDNSFKSFKNHITNGGAGTLNHEITIYPRTANNHLSRTNRRSTFGTIFHEFKHVKQNQMAYQTDPEKLVEAYLEQLQSTPEGIDFIKNEVMKPNKCSQAQALKYIKLDMREQLDQLFSKFPKFNPNSDEYKKGLDYIENVRTYTHEGKRYFEQIQEQEAFKIGDKAKEIFDYIDNPWRVF